jgi:hypothetical protein
MNTLGIMNINPLEYTPLISIPMDSSPSSDALNFEGSVLSIGDYYYDNKTRSIKNRSLKRKRGEDSKSKSHARRTLEWKVGPDPKENSIQLASTLNDFPGLNASYVLQVRNSLNTTGARVTELEIELKDLRDQFNIDVWEVVSAVESLNSGKISASLQAQRYNMNQEFENRMKILRDTHKEELEVEKHKLSVFQENTSASMGTMESIKYQALAIIEVLNIVKNNLLSLMIDIRVERQEKLNLHSTLIEAQEGIKKLVRLLRRW